jgi:hypothetical protein
MEQNVQRLKLQPMVAGMTRLLPSDGGRHNGMSYWGMSSFSMAAIIAPRQWRAMTSLDGGWPRHPEKPHAEFQLTGKIPIYQWDKSYDYFPLFYVTI